MPRFATPGVYFERADAVAPAITALRTDVAGFVGIAERGPLHSAVPVQSWRQFQAVFGGFTGSGFLAYAVKGFFENGGRKCHVVRVARRELAARASVQLNDSAAAPAWRIEASSPGVWGNQLAVQLRATNRAQTRAEVESEPNPHGLRVGSVTRFERGTLVRLFEPGAVGPGVLRIVAAVDGPRQRLIWNEPLAANLGLHGPLCLESVEYTLTVYWRGLVVAIYEDLSLVPGHPRYAPSLVSLPKLEAGDARSDAGAVAPPLVVVTSHLPPDSTSPADQFGPPLTPGGLAVQPEAPLPLTGGADGLVTLSVGDFVGEPESVLDSDALKHSSRRGLRALESVDEISIVAIPDIHIRPIPARATAPGPPSEPDECRLAPVAPEPLHVPQVLPEQPPLFADEEIFRVQGALVAHCEAMGDRFALLDPPFSAVQGGLSGTGAVLAWRSRFETKCGALYFPWLRVLDPLRSPDRSLRDVPPSGHVAGLFARTDLAVGVHHAPANAELRWVEDLTVPVSAERQAGLNPLGVNAVRAFPGRGIRVYGARTLSSDPDWRYVNVRRLMLMIEEALDLATQWTVFEPNDTYTRLKVQLAIRTFLETLWRQGALAGSQPDQAFFVRCDEVNNPPFEHDRGRLQADVGVAPAVPYEFIVVRVGRTAEELDVAVVN